MQHINQIHICFRFKLSIIVIFNNGFVIFIQKLIMHKNKSKIKLYKVIGVIFMKQFTFQMQSVNDF